MEPKLNPSLEGQAPASCRKGRGATFCILPWIHICGSVDGVWGRCCMDGAMYHDHLYESAEEPVFALKPNALGCTPESRYATANSDCVGGVEDAFNSPNMRQTRLAMLDGRPVKACAHCYEREARGGESYRQKSNRRFGNLEGITDRIAQTASDGRLDSFPFYLDLRLGNTCNLRCIMCTFPVSSGWARQKRHAWSPIKIDPYSNDDQLWSTLRQNAHQLRYLYFAGGEPFLQAAHSKMLELLIETGAAPQIDVVYNSNLTILPTDIFDKLAHFKNVAIGASCDGTGKVFERIRVGGRWETFVRNLRTAKQYVRVWLQVAPQRDNIAHLGDLIEFAVSEGVEIDLTNIVQWPTELSIRSLPIEEKRQVEKQLTVLIDECRSKLLDQVADHLTMLLAFMKS